MGQGIDLAREDAPIHAQIIDDFKDQLLIVFLRRLGGKLVVPVKEVDDTGKCLLAFSIDKHPITGEMSFNFELEEKQ